MLEDGEGRRIDFKNTLIILTSNIGTDLIMKHCYDNPESAPDMETLKSMLTPVLQQRFKPAFLGRLQVVPYYPIHDEIMRLIIRLKLDRIKERMLANRKIRFDYPDAVVDAIADRCTEVDSGARNVDHILTDTLLPDMSRRLLEAMAAEVNIDTVEVFNTPSGFEFNINHLNELN
jgi:type VI secretion system protein VasG